MKSSVETVKLFAEIRQKTSKNSNKCRIVIQLYIKLIEITTKIKYLMCMETISPPPYSVGHGKAVLLPPPPPFCSID